MRNFAKIAPTQRNLPIELQHLGVVAYYRVSTEVENQTSSLELQGSTMPRCKLILD